MPEMQAVGAQIQPPNLGMLSSVYGVQQQRLGLQQQQLALQTGQQQLQTQTAEAQQANQKNQELQALATFTKNAAQDPSYLNEDGTANTQKYQQGAMSVAPTYGQAYIGNATANFTASVENRRALLQLSNEQRQTAGNYLAAEAANPNANAESFKSMTQRMREVSNDKGYQSAVDSLMMHAPNTATMSDAQAAQALRSYARQVAVATQAPGAGLSAPEAQPYYDEKGNLKFYQKNIQAPGGLRNIGPPEGFKTGVAPQVVTPPGGIPGVIAGRGPAPTPGIHTGPPPTDQDMQVFQAYEANLNSRVQSANKSLPQLRLADQALNAINAGGGSATYADIASRLNAVGAPKSLVDAVANGNLAQTQLAEKYLFQSALGTLMTSGGANTNDQVQRALTILPHVGTDPRASHELIQVLSDQGKADYAEQNALVNAREKGTFNPATWQNQWATQLRGGKAPGVPSSQVPQSGELPKKVTRTGTYKGRKVVQYSDGSMDYSQ